MSSSHHSEIQAIDSSPKFNEHGDRIWLANQRAHTRREFLLTCLTFPIYLWRQSSSQALDDAAQTIAERLSVPDPTIIIPTMGEPFERLYTEPPLGTTETRFERRQALQRLKETWSDTRPRSLRVVDVDRRPLWDPQGHRVILAVQRHYTFLEGIGFAVTFPWFIYRSFRNFVQVIAKADREGLGGNWRVEELQDPTIVTPTGAPNFLPGELSLKRPSLEVNDEKSEGDPRNEN